MKGKLIVIEGTDGSGKKTQSELLAARLKAEGLKVKRVEFPNYQSSSSALIKMYLNGEFGQDPLAVNPYAASAFYAVDRYASYKTDWERWYKEGGIIIADRYTTSNMIHQAAKFDDIADKKAYLDWLCDFEFDRFGLPVPDMVVFLDMPPEHSAELISQRAGKIPGNAGDIHEQDWSYLARSYRNAAEIADMFGWQKVACVADRRLKSIEDVHNEIYGLVRRHI